MQELIKNTFVQIKHENEVEEEKKEAAEKAEAKVYEEH